VHPDPSTQLLHATVVFKDGRITAILPGEPGPDGQVGTADDTVGRVPLGPRVIPATDLHVYPGLIEPFAEVDAPLPQSNASGLHWNPKVTPQRNALDSGSIDAGLAGALRKQGYTAAALAPKGGIFRGSSEVVSLAKPSEEQSAEKPPVYASRVYQVLGFDTGGGYPSALMGSISLIRQTFFDADWQAAARERGEVVGGMNAVDDLVKKDSTWFVADCTGELNALRAMKIARESGRRFVVLGNGREYVRLEALRGTGAEMILPLQFPKQPDVSSVAKIEGTELETLMGWEQAPTNLRRVAGAGIKFSLTTHRLRDKSELWSNLRLAVAAGLPEEEALAALTTRPAELLGVDKWMGTIAVGKFANLVVADGPLLEKGTKIRSVWVDGREHVIFTPPVDLQGTWTMDVQGAPPAKRTLEITKENEVTIHRDEKSVKATKVAVVSGTVSWVFDHEPLDGKKGQYASSAAIINDAAGRPIALRGQVVRPDGTRTVFSAQRQAPSDFEPFAGMWDVSMDGDRPRPFAVQVKKPEGDAQDGWSVTIRTQNEDSAVVETAATNVTATRLDLAFDVQGRGRVEFMRVAREPSKWRGTVGGEGATAMKRAGDESSPSGTWRIIETDGQPRMLSDPDGLRLTITRDSVKLTVSAPGAADVVIDAQDVKVEKNVVTFTHPLEPIGGQGNSSDTVTVEGNAFIGVSTLPDGSKHVYRGWRVPQDEDGDDSQWRLAGIPEALPLPFGPYGLFEKIEPAPTLVIMNATIWTSGPQGIIEKGTVIVNGDRIAVVADGALKTELPEGAVVIDGTGKHLTAGLIDAHSHTGISGGVNEFAQAVTSEVRIQDVTNPDSVDWYRQLASGVTSVLSLHGSANAIGGQSQVIRLRWGAVDPDEMHDAGAVGGIKFALGENPTGKNRDGSSATQPEYPRTRMGVEMLIRDRFVAAKEYLAARARDPNTRRDLELEALGEVLEGKRLVHCHSYRQDEIVMLCMVAKEFDIKIGTFQHILEGYKVAEYVRDYSGGGSGFADWWAYKIEVQDAIPQGLPLMHDVGAVVSFNSDSNEMARRMNVEAAKAVKYGRLSQAEALNFVTINPARQLKIDGWTGSIEVGKMADLALWNGSPLSTFSKCERTWIEGRELFSLEKDDAHRRWILGERHRIIQKILSGKSKKKEADEAAPEAGSTTPGAQEGRRRRRPTEDERMESSARALQREFLEGVRRRGTQGECGCGLDHSIYEEQDRAWSHQ
jgi:imidazolonepropionase-like amidohydrolase